MYYLETTCFIQIWREMSTWFENTFLVVQAYKPEIHFEAKSVVKCRFSVENTFLVVPAYRLENSLLGEIWLEMSILGRKHKVLCIT